jgi:1-phosphatidylinositol-3-phosphate 5-kinase
MRLIGGTFSLKGVTSSTQHDILFKALRISVYMYLSLLLEQHFLANSNVQLKFPKPKQTKVVSAELPPKASNGKPRPSTPTRHMFSPTGIFSFFSKKTGNFLHRTHTISPILGGRGGSLDLTVNPSPTRSSEDGGGFSRLRRFSFISESTSASKPKEEPDHTFSYAVARIEKCKDLLSTSIGVSFAPPPLIVALAEKEKNDPSRRLKGDEKAGLTSILGWDGREVKAKGMVGVAGFVRQQELSILYSQHVASSAAHPPISISSLPLPPDAPPSAFLPSSRDPPLPFFSLCGRARWITFRYYSRHRGPDRMLGEMISELCDGVDKQCDTPKCQSKRIDHQLRFIHGGVRIALDVDPDNNGEMGRGEEIEVWESCNICKLKTERSQMSDGT